MAGLVLSSVWKQCKVSVITPPDAVLHTVVVQFEK